MFNNQRLITLTIALLCFLQLAIVLLREFSESGSIIHSTANQALNLVNKGLATGSYVALRQDDTPTLNKQTATIKTLSEAEDNKEASNGVPVPARGSVVHSGSGRDPFVPFFKVRGDEETSAKGELTSYELDQLKVTAVIRTSLGAVSASLESRDGRSFIIRPGTKIGVRGGIVEEITDAGVVVVREVSGIDGVTVARRELGIR